MLSSFAPPPSHCFQFFFKHKRLIIGDRIFLPFHVGHVCLQVTYTSLLTQCARLGQADKARVVLDELNKRRTKSSISNRNSVSSSGTNLTDSMRGDIGGVGDGSGAGSAVEASNRSRAEASGAPAGAAAPGGAGSAGAARGKGGIKASHLSERVETTAVVVRDGSTRRTEVATPAEAVRGRGSAADNGGESGQAQGGAWRMDRKLEGDLLKLFGQADQVDEAFKVKITTIGWTEKAVEVGAGGGWH